MEIKQQLKLSQQLVMTPQLQQAIRLLQLSRLELIDEIRKELDANPVLADEEVEPGLRVNGNGDAKNGEVILEPRAPDAPAMSSEKLDASDLEKRGEDKRVQEIDWEQFLEKIALFSSRCPATGAALKTSLRSSRTSPKVSRSSTTCGGSCR